MIGCKIPEWNKHCLKTMHIKVFELLSFLTSVEIFGLYHKMRQVSVYVTNRRPLTSDGILSTALLDTVCPVAFEALELTVNCARLLLNNSGIHVSLHLVHSIIYIICQLFEGFVDNVQQVLWSGFS